MSAELMRAVEAESVVFARSLRGYNPDDVDDFLDRVADSLQRYAMLSADLELQNRQLEEKLVEYETLRDSWQDALVMAKRSSEEQIEKARQQADAILAEAHQQADALLAGAKDRLPQACDELRALQLRRQELAADMKVLVERFNQLIGELSADDWNHP